MLANIDLIEVYKMKRFKLDTLNILSITNITFVILANWMIKNKIQPNIILVTGLSFFALDLFIIFKKKEYKNWTKGVKIGTIICEILMLLVAWILFKIAGNV